MPCPSCHAPDLQGVPSNYCFHCGTSFNPLLRKEEKSDKRAITLFVIITGMHIVMSLFYMVVPRFMSAFISSSNGYTVFYTLTSGFFLVAELVLLIFCAVNIRHMPLRVMLILFCCFRLLIGIAGIVMRW